MAVKTGTGFGVIPAQHQRGAESSARHPPAYVVPRQLRRACRPAYGMRQGQPELWPLSSVQIENVRGQLHKAPAVACRLSNSGEWPNARWMARTEIQTQLSGWRTQSAIRDRHRLPAARAGSRRAVSPIDAIFWSVSSRFCLCTSCHAAQLRMQGYETREPGATEHCCRPEKSGTGLALTD